MQNNAIVVLYYNKIRLTIDCVRSILAAGYPATRMNLFICTGKMWN